MRKELCYVNLHAHRPSNHDKEWVLRNIMAKEASPGIFQGGFYSVGLHPYHADSPDEEMLLERVAGAVDHENVLALGEIGLDKTIGINMKKQQRIFERQMEIAEKKDLPVILHVVKTHNEMIRFMKVHRPSVPMIVHGFRGGLQVASDLIRSGFYLSFGEHILQGKSKTIEALLKVPVIRMFLETDESTTDIREIYRVAAGLKGMDPYQLQEQMINNSRNCLPGFRTCDELVDEVARNTP